jgi:hypothetical protein
MEFLPGSGYYFNMNFHNYTQQMQVAVTTGGTQSIDFQTTLVTLNLKNHSGNLITSENGTGGYYSGGWYTVGSTSGTGHVSMEFLPGSGHYFNEFPQFYPTNAGCSYKCRNSKYRFPDYFGYPKSEKS